MSRYGVGDFTRLYSKCVPELVGWYPSWPNTLSENSAAWYLWNPQYIQAHHFAYWDGNVWWTFLGDGSISGHKCVCQQRYWFGLRRVP
jgi:hypothetical protein